MSEGMRPQGLNAIKAGRQVLENGRVSLTEITLKPGEKAPMHDHPGPYVVYALTDTRYRQTLPDGSSGEMSLKKGEAAMMDAGAHEVANIGKNVVRNLVIMLR
jgi:beta-alanine degradation protein BauB